MFTFRSIRMDFRLLSFPPSVRLLHMRHMLPHFLSPVELFLTYAVYLRSSYLPLTEAVPYHLETQLQCGK
ncbi:unnamed protein product [Closterium sp. Naga37s-1]|nr:unnamed protein product [Closterium sp. Naga37s-1]